MPLPSASSSPRYSFVSPAVQVPEKVSATPVNNRFRDLQNQLALAYEGNDDDWTKKLGLTTDIDTVFRNAQKAYGAWSKLDPEERTTKNLMDRLDFDFFKVLDQVTVARSRRHVKRVLRHERDRQLPRTHEAPDIRPKLSTRPESVSYDQIYDELEKLKLALYTPSEFSSRQRLPNTSIWTRSRVDHARSRDWRSQAHGHQSSKRFESSVHSFRVTLKRVYGYMDDTVKVIDKYEQHRAEHKSLGMFDRIDADVFDEGFDLDRDDAEEIEFTTQGKTQFALSDMDWKSWRSYIQADMRVIEGLLAMIRDIDPEHDAKLQRLYQTIRDKQERPINEGNRRILVFTAFADTADYLYEHVSEYAQPLGLETAEVTGSRPGRCTVKKVGGDMGDILACFSPESKERGVTDPGLSDCDIDILIATDCISEGQNLQDCDMMVNYDIHWNPVRIVQRFGRVDRIGSTNQRIQLVNYWPDMDLDKYLRLKDRVEARMRLTVMTSTGDDDYINENEHGDLAYREKQLKQMQTEIPDLEDVEGGISITDLGLNEFRMDLVEYHKKNPDIKHVPTGINAIVQGTDPGILFVLRNVNNAVNIGGKNQIHPYYLVYVRDDGQVEYGHLEPKACLNLMRSLCKGRSEYDPKLCAAYNKATRNGKDMRHASAMLEAAVGSIVQQDERSAVDSLFGNGLSTFLDPGVQGLDDFELVCFLVVQGKEA